MQDHVCLLSCDTFRHAAWPKGLLNAVPLPQQCWSNRPLVQQHQVVANQTCCGPGHALHRMHVCICWISVV